MRPDEHRAPAPSPPPDPAAADLFDWQLVRGYALLVLRAPRRHPRLAAGSLLGCTLAAVLALVLLPKTFHTETTILAERNLVMAALGNPGRAIPHDADAPTRAAAETILRHDNLIALVNQTDLVKSWDETRAPLSRAKDSLLRLLHRPLTEDQKIDALVYTLERRFKITADDRTVTIAIDWPDRQMAYKLVESAQQNFFETRHAAEISTIAEAISILEGHAANVRERIERSLEDLHRSKGSGSGGGGAARTPAAKAARPAPPPREPEIHAPDPRIAQLKLMLVAKRRAIADLEQYRQRRLTELQTQLAEQKATYAAAHPLITATEQSIQTLAKDSPQLAALRREEADILRDYLAAGGKDGEGNGGDAVRSARAAAAPAPVFHPGPAPQVPDVPSEGADAQAQVARSQLNFAVVKYEDLLGRLDAARIELDTARAAFKYRYTIVRPAEPPKEASKPSVPLTLAAGILAGLLLAFGAPALVDLRRGTLVEPWQIERELQVPVLGEVRRP
jgi:uncharacterized protein involved in exopolysaccharide biosynthesis